MFLFSAFSFGFLGSLHCVGMCGPISLALSSNQGRKGFWLNRSLYNLGRMTTYILLGLIFGIFGQSLAMVGIQQALSIGLGILWILALLLIPNWESKLLKIPLFKSALLKLKTGLASILQKQSSSWMYNAGILNGFLPCGLVYIALTGSLASESLMEALMFMGFFGLGTFPAMFAVSYLSQMKIGINRKVKTLLLTVSLLFALMLIVRGLNLGIPYVSPVLTESSELICQ